VSGSITVGCFDMLHEGHAALLHRMREYGPVTVLIHDDRGVWELKKRMPVQSVEHRESNLYLSGLARTVRRVYGNDPSHDLDFLLANGDWTFVRGDDMPDFPGRAVVETRKVPIVLLPYTRGVSSSQRRDEL
jgi:cytidyltransferase-like protein